MSDGARRSIRDIAHLYLSTASSRTSRRARVMVAGTDRECFPGFHVANLAAAMRSDSLPVRVVERSRLLVNSARFLALPSPVYAAVAPVASVIALDGIEVWFAAPPAAGRGVDLIHAPPLDDRAAFDRCYAEDRGARLVLLARRASDVPSELRSVASVVLIDAADETEGTGVIATVTRWRRSLPDTLPATVRDRASNLSRAYRECARRIAGAASYPRSAHVDDTHTTVQPRAVESRPDAR